MSFTGSPARKKGVQTPLKGVQSPLKGFQSPLGLMNRVIRSPGTPHSMRKKQHHEDDKSKFSLAGSAENCDPNAASVKSPNGCKKSPNGRQKFSNGGVKISKVSDGCQKLFDGCQKSFNGYEQFSNVSDGCQNSSKLSGSGMHTCKSRRCGANYPDWASANLRPQPRKFLVAKRIEKPNQQEGMVCKCCEKKSKSGTADRSADAGRKCACIASQQLRASQEEFLKENFGKKKPSGEGGGESSVETQIGNHGKYEIQEEKNGFSEIDVNREEIRVAEPENGNMDEKIDGLGGSELDKGDTFFSVKGNVITMLSPRRVSSGQGNTFSNGNAEKIGVSEPEKRGMAETIQCFEVSELGKGNTLSDGDGNAITLLSPRKVSNDKGNSFSNGYHEKIGISEPENGNMDEKMEGFESAELGQRNTLCNANLERNGVSEPEKGNIDRKMEDVKGSELDKGNTLSDGVGSGVSHLSPISGVSPAPRRPKNELLAEAIGTIPQQGGGRVKHLVKAFESLLSLPDYETREGNQARPLDRSIYNVSDINEANEKRGVGKSLKWALPGMQPKSSKDRKNGNISPFHESYDDQASPLDRSIYDAFDIEQGRQRELGVGKGVNWAFTGILPQGSEQRSNVINNRSPECNDDSKRENNSSSSETSCADFGGSNIQSESHLKRPHSSDPSHESCYDFKFFPVCQETALVGNNDTRSVSSFGRSQSSSRSRRRGRKESLDSTGRGSIGRSGMQQWKKQLKVTSAQPFKLRTEQRGHMKKEEFVKKVQVMLAEEEKIRIPVAQGLPWTTDEPEHLVKPPVKECTKPLDVKLHTEIRAVDRAEFDQIMAEKLNALEQQRLEEERLQKLAEEEEIKRLRKDMIPRAQPMPFFDHPFVPRRSSKSPTIPKEPKFHVPHHKRAKCISWNDFNVCQQ